MRKALFAFALLFGCAAIVCAGPERLSGKEMTQAAVEPEPCDWSGFYIGALAGYKFGATDVDMDLFGDWSGFATDAANLEAAGSRDLDRSRVEVGGLIGYMHQFGHFVAGAEVSGAYVWPEDESRIVAVPGGDIYSVHSSLSTHYLVTAGPRLGFTVGRFLPYVTGGVAIGDIDFSQLIVDETVFFLQGDTKNEDKVGWFGGAGLQFCISRHWSMRAQYQYVDLGCVQFDSIGTSPYRGFLGSHEACLREHNANFALI